MEKNLYIDASHPDETRVVLKENGNIEMPEYIKNSPELMSKIIDIDFDSVNSPSKGNFDIFLKTIK